MIKIFGVEGIAGKNRGNQPSWYRHVEKIKTMI